MIPAGRRHRLDIWVLALGYFLVYIPYSGITKAVTSGVWIGRTGIPGYELLVPAAVATVLLEFCFITAMGWWKHSTHKRIFNYSIPWPGRGPSISGLGYAAIIITTTLAYSLSGVSILLALLLMRGGVLIIAPMVDFCFRRRVRWFSWAALLLSLAALLTALGSFRSFHVGLAAVLTLAGYLAGYAVRLPCMSQTGKVEDGTTKLRYFVEEQTVAMPAVLLAPFLWALISSGSAAQAIRHDLAHFFSSPATAPGLVIGALYAGLGTFCTFIYLDRRENSFCIPLYSCSSLLSGVVAAYGLHWFCQLPAPANSQIVGSVFMLSALLVLSPLHHLPEKVGQQLQRPGAKMTVGKSWAQSDCREVSL